MLFHFTILRHIYRELQFHHEHDIYFIQLAHSNAQGAQYFLTSGSYHFSCEKGNFSSIKTPSLFEAFPREQ
jgi:hypothetical protein